MLWGWLTGWSGGNSTGRFEMKRVQSVGLRVGTDQQRRAKYLGHEGPCSLQCKPYNIVVGL